MIQYPRELNWADEDGIKSGRWNRRSRSHLRLSNIGALQQGSRYPARYEEEIDASDCIFQPDFVHPKSSKFYFCKDPAQPRKNVKTVNKKNTQQTRANDQKK